MDTAAKMVAARKNPFALFAFPFPKKRMNGIVTADIIIPIPEDKAPRKEFNVTLS